MFAGVGVLGLGLLVLTGLLIRGAPATPDDDDPDPEDDAEADAPSATSAEGDEAGEHVADGPDGDDP